ncbi:MAG: cytochrome c3 family protein [Desulfosarcinaceae bacterium]
MKRKACVGVVVFLGLILCGVAAFSQEDMVVVDNRYFNDPQRTAALFEHEVHNETDGIDDCATCHHVYEDGVLVEDESSEDSSCSDCHADSDDGAVPNLRKAFHLRCKGCHLQNEAGPVMCGECHQW